jgi:hypothetical protein
VAPAELQAAVESAADVPGREAAVNAMVAALIRGEKHARAERFDFEVSAAP